MLSKHRYGHPALHLTLRAYTGRVHTSEQRPLPSGALGPPLPADHQAQVRPSETLSMCFHTNGAIHPDKPPNYQQTPTAQGRAAVFSVGQEAAPVCPAGPGTGMERFWKALVSEHYRRQQPGAQAQVGHRSVRGPGRGNTSPNHPSFTALHLSRSRGVFRHLPRPPLTMFSQTRWWTSSPVGSGLCF